MIKKDRVTKVGNEYAIVGAKFLIEDTEQCDIANDNFPEMIEHDSVRAIRVVSISHNYYMNVWLTMDVKIVENIHFDFTIRKEKKSGRNYWYAYRKLGGKQYKRYVGTSEQITEQRLLEVAKNLPG